jgi:hypothetical protein
MQTNGHPEPGTFRADLNLRVVIDAPSYAVVGTLMDEISAMMEALFRRDKLRAEFDFTSFNTTPCKALRMQDMAVAPEPDYDRPDRIELTQH